MFEMLENRRLFAVQILGTPGNDLITLHQSGTFITVNKNGATTSFPLSQVNGFVVHGLAGNDLLLADDTIHVPCFLYGEDGNDILRGGMGSEVLSGGNGHDAVTYATRTHDLRIDLDNVADDGEFGIGEHDNVMSDVENVYGGSANDVIIGSAADNILKGNGGKDRIDGRDGNDTIDGGAGNDQLFGGKGRDRIHGGAGDDYIVGGPDGDQVWGDDGNDLIYVRDGVFDSVDGGAGVDRCQRDHILFADAMVNVEFELP